MFLHNFCRSISILEKFPLWGSRFGGYSASKTLSEPKMSKFSLFRKATVPKRFASPAQNQFYFAPQGVR